MSRIWSEEEKLAHWLEVELAALDGWAEVGAIPADDVAAIRGRATAPTPERVAEIERVSDAVVRRAREHRNTICIGRSHGIHAEPTTFGWKLAGWAFELDRGRTRLVAALETTRVGQLSGTVGTYAAVEPEVERVACERLGL